MNSPVKSKSSFVALLQQVQSDFLDISFKSSDTFYWTSDEQTIYYDSQAENAAWSLLHELGHMVHDHSTYNSDSRLVRMEVEAWEAAIKFGTKYGVNIDEEYVQDCIDSYRNWQYARSKCPKCEQAGVEPKSGQYKCFNCGNSWRVTDSRFCRAYRIQTN